MTKSEPIDLEYREPELEKRLTEPLARSLRDSTGSVTYSWLERIKDRIDLDEDEIFPSEDVLDHVPLLIEAVADFIEDPGEEGTASDAVMAKAAELGAMRYRQGFSTYQILKEFEILGGVILTFLRSRVKELGFAPEPEDAVLIAHRVYRALAKLQQATSAQHVARLEDEIRDQDQRLRLVRSVVDRSLEAPLDTLLDGADSDTADRVRRGLRDVRALASPTGSRRKGVPLHGTLAEAVRRVRPIAREADIDIRVADSLPDVQVPDAEVEQCLVAYLTNAIRHCDQVDRECWVEVSARLDGREVTIVVRNTGAPVAETDDITRLVDGAVDGGLAKTPAGDAEADGVVPQRGLGLRFARDLIASLGGRTWAEPATDPEGSVFALAVPARRQDDAG